MTGLKKCPFCGAEVQLFSTSYSRQFRFVHVGYTECPFMFFSIPWDNVKSLAEARDVWNRRTE